MKITTPHYCLIGEFGIKPIEFHFYKAALRYWIKVISSDEGNLIKKVYNQIYENIDDKSVSKTWCSQIKNLLYDLKLEELWINQSKKHEKNYKAIVDIRLIEHFREEWINSAKHSQKGLNYLELSRFDCKLKTYLNFTVDDKSVIEMLKIRTGNHSLSVEVDRYCNRKAYEECICKSCDGRRIEDLFHVYCECTKFSELRKQTLDFLKESSKSDFFAKMNCLTKKQMQMMTKFMKVVKETRK